MYRSTYIYTVYSQIASYLLSICTYLYEKTAFARQQPNHFVGSAVGYTARERERERERERVIEVVNNVIFRLCNTQCRISISISIINGLTAPSPPPPALPHSGPGVDV